MGLLVVFSSGNTDEGGGLENVESTSTVLEEGVFELTLIVRTIMIGDSTDFEDTSVPLTGVLDTIITGEFTLTVELMVVEQTAVGTSVGEDQTTVTVVETVDKSTDVLDLLSGFNTLDSQIIEEFTFKSVVFINEDTLTGSLVVFVELTLEFQARLVFPVTFIILLGEGLLSASLVLDFLLELIDTSGGNSAVVIEVVTELLDETDPLVDVDSLVVGIIEEGDDIEDLGLVDTTVSGVSFGEEDVGDFEGVGEELVPEGETLFLAEDDVEIVGEGGVVLTGELVVDISDLVELDLVVFEGLVAITSV